MNLEHISISASGPSRLSKVCVCLDESDIFDDKVCQPWNATLALSGWRSAVTIHFRVSCDRMQDRCTIRVGQCFQIQDWSDFTRRCPTSQDLCKTLQGFARLLQNLQDLTRLCKTSRGYFTRLYKALQDFSSKTWNTLQDFARLHKTFARVHKTSPGFTGLGKTLRDFARLYHTL